MTSTMKSEPGRSMTISPGSGFSFLGSAACAVTVVVAAAAAADFRKSRRSMVPPPQRIEDSVNWYPLCRNPVRESGTKRFPHLHRPRYADGRALPSLLAAGAPRRGIARARLPSGARAHARRKADRIPRFAEPPRPDGRVLRASRRIALVRPQRGKRPALSLPRLEVRLHRPVRGDPVGVGQPASLPAHEAEELSAGRARRRAVGLPGPGREPAAAAGARMGHGAGG